MIRLFHRWPALLAMALLIVLTLSGAALAVFPVAERLGAPHADPRMSVSELAERVQVQCPGLEQVRRSPSGKITAYWFDAGTPGSAVIDPATGLGVASADPNGIERWLKNLHRALLLGDGGRLAMAAAALAMAVLSVSGVALVARRVGGLRQWFSRLRGPLAGRVHVEIARVAVAGLLLSSLSSLFMAAATFEVLPASEATPAFPAEVSGQTGVALADVAVFAETPVSALRELSFPYVGDASDVFTLTTDQGSGYVDQGTGAVLVWDHLTVWAKVNEFIYMVHTGQGAAVLGVILGSMALGVPALALTGLVIWLAARRGRVRIRGNKPAGRADTIVLVGSEGGSTWGFAATLHKALTQAGFGVHAAQMSAFDPMRYAQAKRIIVLAATYGDGEAPETAKGFLGQLERATPIKNVPMAVLGFGDRSFPTYCAYAQAVYGAADAAGWQALLPLDTVDRQSPQDFARWGRALGEALGQPLELVHEPARHAVQPLTLLSRRDYGQSVQAPTAILRFALPARGMLRPWAGRFQAGDLVGIVPEGSTVPRFYSLASSRRDGVLEIVVKKHAGGLCSGQLMALEPGDAVQGFIRPNRSFHAGRGRKPLVLIGAGTGIGPLAGMIRANRGKRPLHLFFGLRHPDSDFLYDTELADWQAQGRLARLSTAASRSDRPKYVQDAVREEAVQLVALVRGGARIMVCGGRDMAAGVAEALGDVLAPIGLSAEALRAQGRYVEDVY